MMAAATTTVEETEEMKTINNMLSRFQATKFACKIKCIALLLCCLCSFYAEAQQYLLSGKVTDAQLDPLSFVTVQLRGQQIGTRTDEKGHYEFQLEEGEYEIVFSLMGYKKQAIKFIHKKDGEPQNVILQNDANKLGEVKIISQDLLVTKKNLTTAFNEALKKK